MLGVLITLLLTPAFARWMYYEFGTAEGTQIEHPVHLGEFNYAPQTVTLPGDVTTPPEVTTPPSPGVTTPPTETPVVPEGENHSALIYLITLSGDQKLDINIKNSILEKNILTNKDPVFYSMKTSNSGGNSAKELEEGLLSVDAEQLEFIITAKFSGDTATEIVVYSYKALNQSNDVDMTKPCEVYQIYFKYEGNKWVQDKSRTYVGKAAIIEVPGKDNFLIPDYQNITYT